MASSKIIFADQTVAAEFEKEAGPLSRRIPVPRQILPRYKKKAGCGSAISGVLGMGAIVLSVGACLLTLRVRKRK